MGAQENENRCRALRKLSEARHKMLTSTVYYERILASAKVDHICDDIAVRDSMCDWNSYPH